MFSEWSTARALVFSATFSRIALFFARANEEAAFFRRQFARSSFTVISHRHAEKTLGLHVSCVPTTFARAGTSSRQRFSLIARPLFAAAINISAIEFEENNGAHSSAINQNLSARGARERKNLQATSISSVLDNRGRCRRKHLSCSINEISIEKKETKRAKQRRNNGENKARREDTKRARGEAKDQLLRIAE